MSELPLFQAILHPMVTRSRTNSGKRIMNELNALMKHPVEGCTVIPNEDDNRRWLVLLEGPKGTVYEDGTFKIDVYFEKDYPTMPPSVKFITKIYHCNVSSIGYICMDLIHTNWRSTITMSTIFVAIQMLLKECNPDDPYQQHIAATYLSNRSTHDSIARKWTQKFATAEGTKETTQSEL